MANNKNKLVIIAGTVLVLALVGVTVLLLTEKQTNKELVQEFQLEKEDLENEYTRFAQQYDELKLTVSNDSLSVLLEQEQLKRHGSTAWICRRVISTSPKQNL